MRHRTSLAIGLLALLVAGPAAANGRFPTAQHVVLGAGAASGTVLLRTTFGLVVSDDGAATFRYLCEDALGYPGGSFDPPVSLTTDGSIAVGLYNGAVTVAPDRCSFPRTATLEGQFIADLDSDPTGRIVVACTATGFTDDLNHVFRSEDSGATFLRLGPGVKGTLFETVELAATRDTRLYATALQLTPRRVIVYRSDDGGATLVDLSSFPQGDSLGAFVSAVDPLDPDVVYVRVLVGSAAADGGSARVTALLRSRDAGATWAELVRSKGEMLGFAISGDGKTLWYGGPDDGLVRSTDRGATWTHLGDARVQCLRWGAGRLYVCGQNERDHFALADSCDDGATLHPLLGFSSIAGVFTCPASSPEASQCPTRFATVQALFPAGDLPLEPLCTTSLDAGPPDALPDVRVDAPRDTALADVAIEDVVDARSADAGGALDSRPDDTAFGDSGGADAGATEGAAAGCGCSLPASCDDGAAGASLAIAAVALIAAGRRVSMRGVDPGGGSRRRESDA